MYERSYMTSNTHGSAPLGTVAGWILRASALFRRRRTLAAKTSRQVRCILNLKYPNRRTESKIKRRRQRGTGHLLCSARYHETKTTTSCNAYMTSNTHGSEPLGTKIQTKLNREQN